MAGSSIIKDMIKRTIRFPEKKKRDEADVRRAHCIALRVVLAKRTDGPIVSDPDDLMALHALAIHAAKPGTARTRLDGCHGRIYISEYISRMSVCIYLLFNKDRYVFMPCCQPDDSTSYPPHTCDAKSSFQAQITFRVGLAASCLSLSRCVLFSGKRESERKVASIELGFSFTTLCS